MSHNEALLGELRKYLGSAQHNPQVRESEQVLALKHDLNLAARVGQQLLMQLQAAEKQNKANEIQLEQLKASNTRLAQENQRLAAEHELLSETLESQDAEIASLVQRLQDAMKRSAKLSKTSQTARNLEKEVELLEQMQSDLRIELEANIQRRDAAERLARNLANHIASTYKDLRADIGHPLDDSVLGNLSLDDDTRDTTINVSPDVSHHMLSNASHKKSDVSPHDALPNDAPQHDAPQHDAPQHDASQHDVPAHNVSYNPSQRDLSEVPELTNDSTTEPNWSAGMSVNTSANTSVDSFGVHPIDTATPLRPFRPKHSRAHSHESVLSLVPPPPLFKTLIPSPQLDTNLAPMAVTALSGQHSFTASSSAAPRPAGTSARDRLSQMAPDRKPRIATESRWHFTPFRR